MDIYIDDVARKRGDPDERIIAVWNKGADTWCWLDTADVRRQLRIGHDENGRACEVVALGKH